MESIGAAAGVLQVAQIGVELSKGLYKFAADFKHSRRTLERIAEDIHVLAIVLEQVDGTIKSASWLIKPKALEDFSRVLNGTNEAFIEVRDLLDSIGNLNASGKLPFSKRAQWALSKKDKMELLRVNLAQLKASLDLMLHVLQLSIGTRVAFEDRETINSLRADIERIHNEKQIIKEQYDRLLGQHPAAMFSLPHSANPQFPPEASSAMVTRASKKNISKKDDNVLAGLTLCAYAVANLSQTIETACTTWQDDGVLDFQLIRHHLDRAIQAVDILLSDPATRQPPATYEGIGSDIPWLSPMRAESTFSSTMKDPHRPRSSLTSFGPTNEVPIKWCSSSTYTDRNQIRNYSNTSPTMTGDLRADLEWRPQESQPLETSGEMNFVHPQSASTMPTSSAAIKYTRTGRISKASKGQRFHHCDECGKVRMFITRADLLQSYVRAEHLRRHQQNHKPGPFPCDFAGCGRSFHREDLLNRHKLEHNDSSYVETDRRCQRYHETDWFSCDLAGCGRSFHREDLLTRHKLEHNDSCVETGRRHQRYHETDWFSCDFAGCGRAFHRENLLTRHKAQHRYPLPPSLAHIELHSHIPSTAASGNTLNPIMTHSTMIPPIHVQDRFDRSQGETDGSNQLNTRNMPIRSNPGIISTDYYPAMTYAGTVPPIELSCPNIANPLHGIAGVDWFTDNRPAPLNCFSPQQPLLSPSTTASGSTPHPPTILPQDQSYSSQGERDNSNALRHPSMSRPYDSSQVQPRVFPSTAASDNNPDPSITPSPVFVQCQLHSIQGEIDGSAQPNARSRAADYINFPPSILEPAMLDSSQSGGALNSTREADFRVQGSVVDKLLQEWTVVSLL